MTKDDITIDEIFDKLWNDAWGKAGLYNFDGTGEDTLTKYQAKQVLYELLSSKAETVWLGETPLKVITLLNVTQLFNPTESEVSDDTDR